MSQFQQDQQIKPISTSQQGKFYSDVHQHTTSLEFRMNCMSLFDSTTFTEDHLDICLSISSDIRDYLLRKVAAKFPTSNRLISQRHVSITSHARIRYIAGYCLAKVRHKFITKKETYRYNVSREGQEEYKKALCAVQLLEALKNEENYVAFTTSYPSSLEDIDRKQNINHSLTYVSDAVFKVFLKLTEKAMSLFKDENLNNKGEQLFTYLQEALVEDLLFQEFFEAIILTEVSEADFEEETDITLKTEQSHVIFEKMVKLYLMVLINQFRKDIIESFKISKKMAHRKQVRVSTSKSIKSSSKKTTSSVHKKEKIICIKNYNTE